MTHVLLRLDAELVSSVRALEGDGASSRVIVQRWKAASAEVFPQIDRLAVAYKALFFFCAPFRILHTQRFWNLVASDLEKVRA